MGRCRTSRIRSSPYVGLNAVAGKTPEQYGLEPLRFDDMIPGCYDPVERVKDVDVDGVHSDYWGPLWDVFEDTGVVVSLHFGSGSFAPGFSASAKALSPNYQGGEFKSVSARTDGNVSTSGAATSRTRSASRTDTRSASTASALRSRPSSSGCPNIHPNESGCLGNATHCSTRRRRSSCATSSPPPDPAGAEHYQTIGIIQGMKHLPATFTPGPRSGDGLDERIARMQVPVDEERLAEPITARKGAASGK